jgi:bifunctional non-homologous end joining protein LigD
VRKLKVVKSSEKTMTGESNMTTITLEDTALQRVEAEVEKELREFVRRDIVGLRRDPDDDGTSPAAAAPLTSPPVLPTYPPMLRTLPAGFIAPCLPMTAPRPPSGPLWLHEVKHDGFRVIVRKEGERVRLYSRPGNDLTKRFPQIVKAMARLPACMIDGEAVACDNSGVPSFDLLRHRQRDNRVFLYAFDLIELSGKDLRREPLEQRKVKLRRLLADAAPGLLVNEWIDGDEFDGTTVFEHAQSLGLEGIVSKRKDSRYVSGRSPYWLKMKNPAAPAAQREAEEDWGR